MVYMVQNRYNLEYEVILLLLREATYLRGIAKKLSESHSTILRKVNRLVEENVLDFNREGKNKIFFIKKTLQAESYIFNAERYKLIKLLKQYPQLSIIFEDVLKKCKEKLIILFGSYAKFAARKESDIDLFIETRNRKTKEEIELIHSKLRVKIGSLDKSSYLIKEIMKDHVILKGAEEFYEKIKTFE